MNQPTKEIKTPNGSAVLLREWITGRQQQDIQKSMLGAVDVGAEGKVEATNLNAETIDKFNEAMIQNIVISIDGKTEDLVNVALDLRSEDYNFLIGEVSKVFNPLEGATDQ